MFFSPTSPAEAAARTGLLAIMQTALGCGAGLLIAQKLRPAAQKTTAFTILSIGLASTLPMVAVAVFRSVNRPESERAMRRRLESIRDDSGFSEDIY